MEKLRQIHAFEALGILLRLKNNDLSILTELGNASEITILNAGTRKYILPSKIEWVDALMITDQQRIVKAPKAQHYTRKAIGKGLVSTDQEEWIKRRKQVRGIFGHEDMKQMGIHVMEIVNLKIANTTGPVDLYHFFNEITISAIRALLFGNIKMGDEEPILENLNKAIRIAFNKILSPVSFLSDPFDRQLNQSKELLIDFIKKDLDEAVSSNSNCLVNKYFSGGDYAEDICNIFLAGFETTANTLFWLVYELSKRPEMLEKVREELKGAHSYQDINVLMGEAPFTTTCIKETLRLYPPGWIISRSPISSMVIEEIKIDDNCDVIVSPYLFHRLDKYWKDPDIFDPSRFAGGYDPSFYFPFGKGPRMCIGERVAYLEILLIMKILTGYNFRLEDKVIKPKAYFTLRPDKEINLELL